MLYLFLITIPEVLFYFLSTILVNRKRIILNENEKKLPKFLISFSICVVTSTYLFNLSPEIRIPLVLATIGLIVAITYGKLTLANIFKFIVSAFIIGLCFGILETAIVPLYLIITNTSQQTLNSSFWELFLIGLPIRVLEYVSLFIARKYFVNKDLNSENNVVLKSLSKGVEKLAYSNMHAASTFWIYQPKEPKCLKNKK